jgi:glycosyltransferase involved in cell wall biosynthesis
MISLIIPTYRNPDYFDLCLKSVIENQVNKNEIVVAVDGYIEESQHVSDKYKQHIQVLDLVANKGMQMAVNVAVMNANNDCLVIINDDNVLCKDWDIAINNQFQPVSVLCGRSSFAIEI